MRPALSSPLAKPAWRPWDKLHNNTRAQPASAGSCRSRCRRAGVCPRSTATLRAVPNSSFLLFAHKVSGRETGEFSFVHRVVVYTRHCNTQAHTCKKAHAHKKTCLTHTCRYARIHSCVHANIVSVARRYMCVDIYIYLFIYFVIYLSIFTFAYIYIYIYLHIYIHIFAIYVYVYIYVFLVIYLLTCLYLSNHVFLPTPIHVEKS